jgi:hypothetical protein
LHAQAETGSRVAAEAAAQRAEGHHVRVVDELRREGAQQEEERLLVAEELRAPRRERRVGCFPRRPGGDEVDDAGDRAESGTGPGDPGGELVLAGKRLAADQGRGAASIHQQRCDLGRQAEPVLGDQEMAGRDPPERRGVDRFGFGSDDMPGRKALRGLV